MISLSPSTSRWSSSGETRPSFLPRRRVDNVRIWLIFTQAGFPTFTDSSSKTRGNPARWGWLVNAMAMTVPECSKYVGAEDDHWTTARLLMADHGIQVGPNDIAPQNSGHSSKSAAIPSSAILCSRSEEHTSE